MNPSAIHRYDHVTLRPLNELAALHEFDITIQVVPAYEADADKDRISEDAPLGRAVLGASLGEKVTLQVQGRSLSMLIIAVGKEPASARLDEGKSLPKPPLAAPKKRHSFSS